MIFSGNLNQQHQEVGEKGIFYADDTITVTGGSQDDPFTMDDLDNDGTVGTYVTAGGYGNKKYTVTKDLVIGSDAADTFFDIFGTIIEMAAGSYLTVYTTALRGGRMGPTFGDRASDSGVVPFTTETVQDARLENIRQLYIERAYYLENASGVWTRSSQTPRIVAISANEEVTDGVYSA